MLKTPFLVAQAVSKEIIESDLKISILRDINLQLVSHEMIVVIGPSGSGKSTLLHILGGLDEPTSGEVFLNGIPLHNLTEAERCRMRNQQLGFIYQFHHLLPEFTALENVAMPLLIRGIKQQEAFREAKILLDRVGLAARFMHRPGELSGGERQRVAVARALVTHPRCILADEPTGNLDHQHALEVYQYLETISREFGTAVLVVTHDLSIVSKETRILELRNGTLNEVIR